MRKSGTELEPERSYSIGRMEQMMRVKILAMVLLCARFVSAADKSSFKFSAAFGSHAVGFRVVPQYDYTRSYKRVDAEGNLITGELEAGKTQ